MDFGLRWLIVSAATLVGTEIAKRVCRRFLPGFMKSRAGKAFLRLLPLIGGAIAGGIGTDDHHAASTGIGMGATAQAGFELMSAGKDIRDDRRTAARAPRRSAGRRR